MKNLFKITKTKKTIIIYLFGVYIFFGSIVRYTMTDDTGYLIAPSIIMLFIFIDIFTKYFSNKK